MLDRIDIFNINYENIPDVLEQLETRSGTKFDPQDVADFIEAEKKFHILEKLRDQTYKVDVKKLF